MIYKLYSKSRELLYPRYPREMEGVDETSKMARATKSKHVWARLVGGGLAVAAF